MHWETKSQVNMDVQRRMAQEENFMLDLALGGPLFEEARQELFAMAKRNAA